MKYAILSDIHSNIEAFSAVLEQCKKLDIGRYIFLGDVVGYGASPKECLELLRNLELVGFVKGNHDEYVSNGRTEMEEFNPYARDAVLWTRNQLDEEDLAFLQKQPFFLHLRGIKCTIVHATLDGPANWGYIQNTYHVQDNFNYQHTPVCFCGHSHSPVAYYRPILVGHGGPVIKKIESWSSSEEERVNGYKEDVLDSIELSIDTGCKYLINVGSVGQPRNHDPRASFAVYDPDENTVARFRVPYDIAATQKKIRVAGLPDILATRLEYGE